MSTTHHSYVHGDGQMTRLYRAWIGMRQRCYNKREPNYINYGARGITVCDEWRNFTAFKKWAMENGYNDSLSIDRIDNNKGYEPSNCRWATCREQVRNRRDNIQITAFGETKILVEWLEDERCPVEYATLYSRIERGWEAERAITQKPQAHARNRRSCIRITAFGETKTIIEWYEDERCKVRYTTLYQRIFKSGWEPERALTTRSRQIANEIDRL